MKALLHILLSLTLLFSSLTLSAQTQHTDQKALELYSLALEKLLADQTQEGLALLEQLVREYPASHLAEKAREYIDGYGNRFDHSGIVPFYLGNLGTSIYASVALPSLFDLDDGVVFGTAGLIGSGIGLWSAWQMSRENNMSFGQDLWIEFGEAVSITNFNLAFSIVRELNGEADWRTLEKLQTAGSVSTAIGSRLGTYLAVRNRLPQAGRAGFVITTYTWSQAYLWMILEGILHSGNSILNNSLAIIVPDLMAAGAYSFWDTLEWSFQRTGLVTVGGLGGLAIAGFTTSILTEVFPDFPPEAGTALILGTSLTGQALTACFTRGMQPERSTGRSGSISQLSLHPSIGPDGIGIQGILRMNSR